MVEWTEVARGRELGVGPAPRGRHGRLLRRDVLGVPSSGRRELSGRGIPRLITKKVKTPVHLLSFGEIIQTFRHPCHLCFRWLFPLNSTACRSSSFMLTSTGKNPRLREDVSSGRWPCRLVSCLSLIFTAVNSKFLIVSPRSCAAEAATPPAVSSSPPSDPASSLRYRGWGRIRARPSSSAGSRCGAPGPRLRCVHPSPMRPGRGRLSANGPPLLLRQHPIRGIAGQKPSIVQCHHVEAILLLEPSASQVHRPPEMDGLKKAPTR
jgi:hypothetical protein